MPPVIDEFDGLRLVCDPDDDDPQAVQGATRPARMLAGLIVRRDVGSALDLGTGCGVLALTLARHARRVVGTDVNPRAIAYARRSAQLSGGVANVSWRQGDWYAPVEGERFDLIACNPPYVVSPDRRLVFRDGSEATAGVVRGAGEHLAPGGLGHFLVNWAHAAGDWVAPLRPWIPAGCDALVVHHASMRPDQYAETWAAPQDRGRWLAWYAEQGIEAIGAAFLLLRRRADDGPPRLQALEASRLPTPRAGVHLERILDGTDLSSRTSDDELRRLALRLAPGVRVEEGRVRAVPTVGVEATLPEGASLAGDVTIARRLLELGLAVPG